MSGTFSIDASQVAVVTETTEKRKPTLKRRMSATGRAELRIADLDPDWDGDGHVTKFEQDVYDMFKAADTDGSGSLNMREVYGVVERSVKTGRKNDLLQKLLAIAVALLILLLTCIGGMTAALLNAYKDVEASGATLASRKGDVMQVASAEYALPLIVAPVMPMEDLARVNSLTVTYFDASQLSATSMVSLVTCLASSPPTSLIAECNGTDYRVKLSSRVDSVLRVNETAAIFYLASKAATEVRVWNGEASIVMADGNTTHPLCHNDMSCSAMTVEDGSKAAGLVAAAEAALMQAGFLTQDDDEDDVRRLSELPPINLDDLSQPGAVLTPVSGDGDGDGDMGSLLDALNDVAEAAQALDGGLPVESAAAVLDSIGLLLSTLPPPRPLRPLRPLRPSV